MILSTQKYLQQKARNQVNNAFLSHSVYLSDHELNVSFITHFENKDMIEMEKISSLRARMREENVGLTPIPSDD